MRALLNTLVLGLLLATGQIWAATPAATYEQGKQYLLLPAPVHTVDPKRIEVAEVFWYGCSHCFDFEPILERWAKTLPADVVLVRSPAIWHPVMELHARAYYTAVALRVLDQVHEPLFVAINVNKAKLATEREISDLFVAHGVPAEKFAQAFRSFGVDSAVRQADARQRSYQIEGTPEIVINGKYRVSAELAGGQEGMLKVADFLIAKERQAKAP